MADWYVDNATGSDLGAGTAVDPFEHIQKALDSASAGDSIYISNSQVEVLTSSLDVTRFSSIGASPTTNALSLYFKVWDRGGPVSVTLPFDRSAPAWGINGNNLVTDVFTSSDASSASFRYFSIESALIYNFTGELKLGQNSVCHNCELHNISRVFPTSTRVVIDNCYIYSTTNDCIYAGQAGLRVFNSYIVSSGLNYGINLINTNASDSVIANCIIKGGNKVVLVNAVRNVIMFCTILDGTTGIEIVNSRDDNLITDNVISGCTTGIDEVSSSTDSLVIGRNGFWNNTTNHNKVGTSKVRLSDALETADPFVNASASDYTLKPTALSATFAANEGPIGACKVQPAGGVRIPNIRGGADQ